MRGIVIFETKNHISVVYCSHAILFLNLLRTSDSPVRLCHDFLLMFDVLFDFLTRSNQIGGYYMLIFKLLHSTSTFLTNFFSIMALP